MQNAPTALPLPRLRLARSADDRLVAGVAGGIAVRLAVDAVFVRAAFVALSAAAGAGLVAYLVLWALAEDPVPTPERKLGDPVPNERRTVAFGMQVFGVLLLLRATGLWFGDAVVWPVALASVGSAVIWARSAPSERARWAALAADKPLGMLSSGPVSAGRLAAGALLVTVAMLSFLFASIPLRAAGAALIATLVAVAGIAIVLGPGVARMARQLTDERRDRIRSQERAEMAAHLHDSVLHTLALIQRSDDPAEAAALARGQERELRAWLRGQDRSRQESLSMAVDALAGRVERLHKVPVEAVVVGDADMDDDLRALVDAASEAAVNAARHAGAATVSVYVEVEPDAVTAYVRDDGKGFDVDAVPADRRGIAESIRGRMERRGGVALVDSEPGEGTEVVLTLPRKAKP